MARVATADAMALVHSKGYQSVNDPVEALLNLCGELSALKDELAERVADLTSADLTHIDRTGQESISALLSSYQGAIKDLGGLLVSVNRLNLTARRVAIEEAKMNLIAGAIRAGVYSVEADLTWDQSQRVLSAIGAECAKLPLTA